MHGKHAVTVTEMRPTGRIEVDGKILTARSNEGWIDQGVKVIVVGEFGGELEIQTPPESDGASQGQNKEQQT